MDFKNIKDFKKHKPNKMLNENILSIFFEKYIFNNLPENEIKKIKFFETINLNFKILEKLKTKKLALQIFILLSFLLKYEKTKTISLKIVFNNFLIGRFQKRKQWNKKVVETGQVDIDVKEFKNSKSSFYKAINDLKDVKVLTIKNKTIKLNAKKMTKNKIEFHNKFIWDFYGLINAKQLFIFLNGYKVIEKNKFQSDKFKIFKKPILIKKQNSSLSLLHAFKNKIIKIKWWKMLNKVQYFKNFARVLKQVNWMFFYLNSKIYHLKKLDKNKWKTEHFIKVSKWFITNEVIL
ncbi:hypothetical protein [Mesomycoplasma neurolyticum]|uniref:Uncharacterized protein n=1 Tax=Mesomycoplasma neurolyticum TaxID=2120 RepID=A0A449A5B5_9BACT|nr:hypothetical protein [Mesomycoplasma neurolyticum]VEU59343.1 Uncharacterised protein [Mesomycoplasma neurolyticum]